jgi:hypothetical protein
MSLQQATKRDFWGPSYQEKGLGFSLRGANGTVADFVAYELILYLDPVAVERVMAEGGGVYGIFSYAGRFTASERTQCRQVQKSHMETLRQ